VSTLFELNEHLRRVVALNFPQPLWITAEVAQLGFSRGNYYLELVQKDEKSADLMAQAQAVIWMGTHRQLVARHGLAVQSVLREGVSLKLQVRPDFHERFGLKLQILDLDPAFTLGQLDLQRRQTVLALREAGLFDRNRQLPLPSVLQRLAVVSSETAAGLQDFRRQLAENMDGYQFDLELFSTAVQGKNAGQEILEALATIARQSDRFDAVVVVRGGGSRLDLAAFDDLAICSAAAQMPLPVLTGIGHDVDESVLDMVVSRALKTPTAVAEFILQHNQTFEGKVLMALDQVRFAGLNLLKNSALQLEYLAGEIRGVSRQHVYTARYRLDAVENSLPEWTTRFLQQRHEALNQLEAYCAAIHPENVLRRGYSITTKNGKAVASPSDVLPGDTLETQVHAGIIVSRVV
jgi:exodeoxyribonuclease VII large subunit